MFTCSAVEYVGGDNVSNANEHNREFNWQPNCHSLRLVLVVNLLGYRFDILLFELDGNYISNATIKGVKPPPFNNNNIQSTKHLITLPIAVNYKFPDLTEDQSWDIISNICFAKYTHTQTAQVSAEVGGMG